MGEKQEKEGGEKKAEVEEKSKGSGEAEKSKGEEKSEKSKGDEGEKKKKKKDDGSYTMVIKMDLHCEGCAQRVKKFLKKSEGVEDVKVNFASNQISITGDMDGLALKQGLEDKTKKKVDVISPNPLPVKKKEKKEEKEEKKSEDKKQPEEKKKEATVKVVVLKIRLHCDGCIQKIRKIVQKMKGVQSVDVDSGKDLVMVKGTMDVTAMPGYLKDKLKRSVEIVSLKEVGAGNNGGGGEKQKGGGEKTAKESGEGEKKEKDKGKEEKKEDKKEGGGGGGEEVKKGGDQKGEKKKDKDKDGKGNGGDSKGVAELKVEDGSKLEMNKMAYYGYGSYATNNRMDYFSDMNIMNTRSIMDYYGQGPIQTYAQPYVQAPTQAYAQPYFQGQGASQPAYVAQQNQGYFPVDTYANTHPPQMFSDENPNACSIM